MKPKANPQLNYRVEKQVQDEYKQVCKENCLDPGALIRQFMLDIIKGGNKMKRDMIKKLDEDMREKLNEKKEIVDYCPECNVAYCQGRYTTGQCE